MDATKPLRFARIPEKPIPSAVATAPAERLHKWTEARRGGRELGAWLDQEIQTFAAGHQVDAVTATHVASFL